MPARFIIDITNGGSERENISCSVISGTLQPHGPCSPDSSLHGIFQARILEGWYHRIKKNLEKNKIKLKKLILALFPVAWGKGH